VLYHTVKFQILRKTKKRIYYSKRKQYLREDGPPTVFDDLTNYGTGYVDRLKLEVEGEVRKPRRALVFRRSSYLHLDRSAAKPLPGR
jgi:hypothetical protein